MAKIHADHNHITGFDTLAASSGNPMTVLINERRTHEFANQQPGLIAISVPEFLVYLHDRGILSITETADTFNRLAALGRTPKLFMNAAAADIRARGGSV